ncbi:F17L21.9 [Salix purpurea]|uniref:F17L21.9 n=1 Tax=Salix purpurea TaxID=77065 RepID=A0A9Q0T963_SALPP|nr:F17L21.9 [Salix purpurea]
MEPAKNLDLIDQAIKKLLAEKRNKETSGDDGFLQDDSDQLLLSKLLSELESLKGNGVKRSELSPGTEEEEVNSPEIGEALSKHENSIENSAAEEIVKELRKLRRQNFVSQCLISAMIVLSVAWQASQLTLFFQFKNGLSRPFKSFGGMVTGVLKRCSTNRQDPENQQSKEVPAQVLPLRIPELPRIDLGSNISSAFDSKPM